MISKVIVVFKITAVAIILNTAAGIEKLGPGVARARQIAALEPLGNDFKIRFPGALPYIITGMRLGVGRALLGVVVAELMAANAGLGYLLRDSSETSGQPETICHRHPARDDRTGEFQSDQAPRTENGALAPKRRVDGGIAARIRKS